MTEVPEQTNERNRRWRCNLNIAASAYEPTGPSVSRLAFVWPALLAQSASDFSAAYSKQLAEFVVGPETDLADLAANWATPNTIALELTTVRLRDFSLDRQQPPALVCTPYALHALFLVKKVKQDSQIL